MWGHQEARAQRKGSDQDRKAALSNRSWSLEKRQTRRGDGMRETKGKRSWTSAGRFIMPSPPETIRY